MGYVYSEEDEATIKRMWLEEGASCSQIARAIGNGVTRNAIIGKIHRKNWQRPGSAGARPKVFLPKAPQTQYQEQTVQRVLPKAKQLENLRKAAGELAPLGPENDFAPHGTCQYIHGDPTNGAWCMCGHPVVKGRSWCPTHMPVVFDQFKTEEANARWRLRKDSQRPDGRRNNGRKRGWGDYDGELGVAI